jgi:tRNA pseudouridine38-40 synthase
MVRYQVILAYDGTEFKGFQRQVEARTVQAVVEKALRQLNWQGNSILAAGRTDTGVHAAGQVIAFDLDWNHSPEDLLRAINAGLPPDVAAWSVTAAAPGFHPRFDAQWRRYRYRLFCNDRRDPLRERFAWRVWPQVEVSLLEQSAQRLVGRYDFGAFGSPPKAGGSTVRTVFKAEWLVEKTDRKPPLLVFDVSADAFLYHMVRRLVSLQVSIALGNRSLGDLEIYLQGSPAVLGLAPPHGLTLEEVAYGRNQ